MKQKFYFFILIVVLANHFFMQCSDFNDTPTYIILTASPAQIASIDSLDRQAYERLIGELKAFQYRFYDELLSEQEAPMILKKLQTKSQLILANKDSQEKFLAHLKHVAGHHKIKFIE
jgi:hypothetical protein